MSKIARNTQKVFAGSATNNGVFGSAQANSGAGTLSNSLPTIQGLTAWASGWIAATLGADKFPCLEEMQAVDYVITTQLAYLFQQGMAEYDAGTTYYQYSMCAKSGTFQIYGSVFNGANVGNDLTNATYWKLLYDFSDGQYFAGGTSTGSANAQAVATTQGDFTLSAGNSISWAAGYANTAATTLAVDGTTATTIKKNGASGLVDVGLGDIIVGEEYQAIYNGTYYVLVSFLGDYAPLANPVFTGGITTPNINGHQIAGINNLIVNGDFAIDQQGTPGTAYTLTAGAALAYTVDQWAASCTGANATVQRVAGSSVDQYALQLNGAASVTGIKVVQPIESNDIYHLAGSTVTLSAKLANSLLTSITWTAFYPSTADNFTSKTQIATGTFTVNSTPTVYSAQIALPSNCTNGAEIQFSVGAQISGNCTIEEVQLEPGSTATPFERLPIEQRLARAFRFFEYLQTSLNGTYASSGTSRVIWKFLALKRATPTMAYSGINGSQSALGTDAAVVGVAASAEAVIGSGSTASARITP